VYAPAQIVVRVSNTGKKGSGEKAAPALFSARAMRKGTALTLALDVAPYALVALVVFTAALGSPVLAQLCAVVIVVYVGNAAFGECDLASAALGDAPRSAYDGKVVWITGASQGLGRNPRGAPGVHGRQVNPLEPAGGDAAAGVRCSARGGREGCTRADPRRQSGIRGDARKGSRGARAREGDGIRGIRGRNRRHDDTDDAGVDYIFHVAGGSQHAAAEDTADEVDRDMFELNTMSAIALTKALLPSMLQRRSGTIVAVGSMAVKCPAPGQATYAATKAALSAFCHSLRGEVADRGVNVTVAHPGPIATGLGGQTRVIFGATLAKSTCDTRDSAGDSAEGSSRGAKVGKKERRLNR
jgi:dehydrogenase/reductase SDR family protein 7